MQSNEIVNMAGGYGPPGGGGYGGPPPGGAPPGGGGYGGPPPGGGPPGFGGPPPGGAPPGGGGYGAPPPGFGGPPGGGYGGPPAGGPPGFGGPPGGGYGGPPQMGGGGSVDTTMPLVLSIASCLCCWPLGIACLVLFFQGKGLADQGDSAGAQAKFGIVKILGMIAIGLGLVSTIINIIMQVAAHG